MAVARVVTFQGVSNERISDLRNRIEAGDQPEGLNPSHMLLLHDANDQSAIAILIFDTEDDYRRAGQVLDAMPAGDTPGSRASVKKYDVAVHATASQTA